MSDAADRDRLGRSNRARRAGGLRLPAELVHELAELLAQILVADLQQFPELTIEERSDEGAADLE
jgi:hypothetical protein